jgi:hypothetical protein
MESLCLAAATPKMWVYDLMGKEPLGLQTTKQPRNLGRYAIDVNAIAKRGERHRLRYRELHLHR